MTRPAETPFPIDRPFRFAEAIRLGITADELRGPRFRTVFHNVHIPAHLQDTLELRCQAAALILPSDAVFCGLTAARLYGLPVPGTDLRIHVAVPAKTPTPPRHRGMKVHEYTIAPEQIGRIDTFLVVRPERLFLELSAALPRIDLIVAGDQMLRRELTDSDSLRGFLSQCYRRRGVQRARAAVPHLEKNADSPPETRLRMLLVDAGLPRPVANQDVHNGWGVWLAKPDLSYPAQKIAIQYEGGHHREDPRQYSYDIERDGRLIDLGWIVIRVDKEMLYKHPEQVINRVRRSLSRGVSGHHAA